jgi:UDP-2,3-diacylglucosamine hydrolase
MKDYFETELGIPVYHKPKEFILENAHFFIGHGDGLGPKDRGYKRMKKIFTNPLAKRLFQALHPDWGVKLGQYFSVKNKLLSGSDEISFLGDENEWLALYAKRKLEQKHYDYFIFGHRHLPMEIKLNEKATYVNLGDWITHFTYGMFDGKKVVLRKWETS